MSKAVAIVGPTASGKSSTAVEVAERFNGEVINGDSVQVYRHLDVGSAKTTPIEMKGIKHHLIDILDIGQQFNVQLFQSLGREKISEIQSQGKLPVIAGGTGLYIKALLYDYDFVPISAPLNEYEDTDTETLYARLVQLDAASAAKIHPHNRQRLVRALQMAESGNLKSAQEEGQTHQMIYDCFIAGLTMPRELLYQRINQRVDQMFDNGLLQEAGWINDNYDWSAEGLHGIGYREFADYFAGKAALQQTREAIKMHTRQFAKRQYTWWNNQMKVSWYDVTQDDWLAGLLNDVDDFLNGSGNSE